MDRAEAERLAVWIASKAGWRVDEITPPDIANWRTQFPCMVHARRQPDGQLYSIEFVFRVPADWARVRYQEAFA